MEVRYKKKWLGRSVGDIVKVEDDYADSLFLRRIAEKLEPLSAAAIKEKLESTAANKVKRKCRKT
jgi:hypothetical protein